MKKLIFFFSIVFLLNTMLIAQEERKVLVEVFTNSHCPLCPPAHNVIENYLTSPNGDKISFIFYHMIYPYNDDPLYWQSKEGSDARDEYYGPFFSTPRGFFDGTAQGSSSGWTASLDNLVATQSPLKILISGTANTNQININAQLTRTGDIPDNNLVIHFVVVEDIYFDGRNSVSDHKHVMRKMFPTPDGQSFAISLNETINIPQMIDLDPLWDTDSLSVVVFVQSVSSKTVYQSSTISHSQLNVTEVKTDESFPHSVKLEQNYPNPFNPSTVITFHLPKSSNVTLKVYDLLGNEVASLADESKLAGSYEAEFDGTGLANGIYFYKLETSNFIETKKMILLK